MGEQLIAIADIAYDGFGFDFFAFVLVTVAAAAMVVLAVATVAVSLPLAACNGRVLCQHASFMFLPLQATALLPQLVISDA